MKVKFIKVKDTKNTIRFQEDSENPAIGTLYIPKKTLMEIKYKDGDTVTVELKVGE